VSFKNTTFKHKAVFEEVLFENAGFIGIPTDFTDACFESDAFFDGAVFATPTSFRNTLFRADAVFVSQSLEPKFVKDVNFDDAVFEGRARFVGSIFSADVSFNRTVFRSNAEFAAVDFKEGAFFELPRFEAAANFYAAKFRGLTIFSGDANQCVFLGEASFKWVKIDYDALLRFEHVGLQKVQFLDADVRKIEFVDVTWPTLPHNRFTNWFKLHRRCIIYDD
jgi:hypothetical protein